MRLGLSINSQSIETSGIVKDYKEALCEYIWNGFEAGANCVSVSHEINELGGVTSITITDDGDGINYDTLSDTFGTFLASQKAGLSLQLRSKANKGKGRFSAFSFALRSFSADSCNFLLASISASSSSFVFDCKVCITRSNRSFSSFTSDFARSITDWSMPSFCEIAKAFDLPGTPTSSL